jgi:hypothetical protein
MIVLLKTYIQEQEQRGRAKQQNSRKQKRQIELDETPSRVNPKRASRNIYLLRYNSMNVFLNLI